MFIEYTLAVVVEVYAVAWMLLGAWWEMQVTKISVVEHIAAFSIVYCYVYEDWHISDWQVQYSLLDLLLV